MDLETAPVPSAIENKTFICALQDEGLPHDATIKAYVAPFVQKEG
jgi:hypothetical protein